MAYPIFSKFEVTRIAKTEGTCVSYFQRDLKISKLQEHQEKQEQQLKLEEEKAEIESRISKEHNEFLRELQECAYHDEFIANVLCTYLSKKFNLNVYVCQLTYPAKDFDLEEDDDENAHWNTEGVKVLKYEWSSQPFLIGQYLQPETGVTYDALKPITNEEGEVLPQKGIYIANVIKDPRIVFFKWPQLGAFYALPISYNSVLFDASFDAGVEARQQFLIAKDNQDKEIAAKEAEWEEREDDPSVIQQERQAYLSSIEPVQEPVLQSQKRELVLCFDSLGQDKEIANQDELLNISQLLSKSWELEEVKALQNDINLQLKYIESLGAQTAKEHIEQHLLEDEQFVEANHEKLAELREQNEKQYQYEVECLKLERLKERLLDKEFMAHLIHLTQYRIVKFMEIIQSALYLIQHEKESINLPGTNKLNWRFVKGIFNEELIQQILAYTHRGPKGKVNHKYQMLDRLLKRLEKIDQDAVDNYNIGLGRLLKYLTTLIRLRRSDIELRREAIAHKRSQIETAKAEVQKIQELKEQSLIQAKEAVPPEELEEWSQEEWEAQFDSEHPLPEILEYPLDEVDDDFSFEIPA